jgi:hypothetical protein
MNSRSTQPIGRAGRPLTPAETHERALFVIGAIGIASVFAMVFDLVRWACAFYGIGQ